MSAQLVFFIAYWYYTADPGLSQKLFVLFKEVDGMTGKYERQKKKKKQTFFFLSIKNCTRFKSPITDV